MQVLSSRAVNGSRTLLSYLVSARLMWFLEFELYIE